MPGSPPLSVKFLFQRGPCGKLFGVPIKLGSHAVAILESIW